MRGSHGVDFDEMRSELQFGNTKKEDGDDDAKRDKFEI